MVLLLPFLTKCNSTQCRHRRILVSSARCRRVPLAWTSTLIKWILQVRRHVWRQPLTNQSSPRHRSFIAGLSEVPTAAQGMIVPKDGAAILPETVRSATVAGVYIHSGLQALDASLLSACALTL